MIARHSAEESRGGGDGVEVVVNEPCHDDVHGDGQYTEKKIYLSRCVCVCVWGGGGFSFLTIVQRTKFIVFVSNQIIVTKNRG